VSCKQYYLKSYGYLTDKSTSHVWAQAPLLLFLAYNFARIASEISDGRSLNNEAIVS